MRRLVTLSSLAAILIIAMAAYAGGAVWEFEGYHRPGDVIQSVTAVAWEHNATLGTPEEGPYLVYLAHGDAESDTWPQVPEESLLVGLVEVHEGPFAGPGGDSYGPHHAVARFEIPDVAAGIYQIFHCNDPCTATLGDVIGGWDLRVIAGSDGRPAEEIADEVRAAAPTAPLLINAESTTTVAAADEVDRPAGGPEHVLAQTPVAEMSDEISRFYGVWQVVVAVVALLLVGQMVRAESLWHWRAGVGAKPADGKGSLDVVVDE